MWLSVRHHARFYSHYQTRICVLSLAQLVTAALNITAFMDPDFALKATVGSLILVQLISVALKHLDGGHSVSIGLSVISSTTQIRI